MLVASFLSLSISYSTSKFLVLPEAKIQLHSVYFFPNLTSRKSLYKDELSNYASRKALSYMLWIIV